jgi:hypothetical protein
VHNQPVAQLQVTWRRLHRKRRRRRHRWLLQQLRQATMLRAATEKAAADAVLWWLHWLCGQECVCSQIVEEQLPAACAKRQQVLRQLHAAHALVVVWAGHCSQLASTPARKAEKKQWEQGSL